MRLILVTLQLQCLAERQVRHLLGTWQTSVDERLTFDDVLVLAWLHEQSGVSGSRLADRLGRSRQSVHRTLRSLERRGLVERLSSAVTEKTAAWGMTSEGTSRVWHLLGHLDEFERRLVQDVKRAERLVEQLTELVRAMRSRAHAPRVLGLHVPPANELGPPPWDL